MAGKLTKEQLAILEPKVTAMLFQAFDVMIPKYKSQYEAVDRINSYINDGDVTHITRDNNLRQNIISSKFRDNIIRILKTKNISFMDYAQELLKNKQYQQMVEQTDEKTARSTMEKAAILTIQEIMQVMTNKYGEKRARVNLEEFIDTGRPNMITSDNGLRERVVNSNFRMTVKDILVRRNLSFNDYLDKVVDSDILVAELYLEQAILETYDKYERKSQEEGQNYTGKSWVEGALRQLITSGNYTGFTNDNNARHNLKNNASAKDVLNIIAKEFGLNNGREVNMTEVIRFVSKYVERVLENNPRKKL